MRLRAAVSLVGASRGELVVCAADTEALAGPFLARSMVEVLCDFMCAVVGLCANE